MGVEDEDYLSRTARDAAHAGWGLIGIFAAIFAVVCLVAMVSLLFHAPLYYVPFIILCLIWALS